MRSPIALLPLVNGGAKLRNQFLQLLFRYFRVCFFRRFHKLWFRFDSCLYELLQPRQHSPFAIALFFVGVTSSWIAAGSCPFAHRNPEHRP